MVSVAQLVESRIVIPVVAGSSPVAHPIKLVAAVIFKRKKKIKLSLQNTVAIISKAFPSEKDFSVSIKAIPCEILNSLSP